MIAGNAEAFVIVISGTSGAGKTSLVRRTAALLGDAACLHFDDYRSVSVYPQPDLAAWLAGGADPNEWRTPQLAVDLQALRQGQAIMLPEGGSRIDPQPFIVVEDPFGRSRTEMAPSIDLVAYLDLPLDVAMFRKLRREMNSSAPQAALDRFNGFVADFLDGPLREAYLAANQSARSSADLILDGMLPLDELAEQVVTTVQLMRSHAAEPHG